MFITYYKDNFSALYSHSHRYHHLYTFDTREAILSVSLSSILLLLLLLLLVELCEARVVRHQLQAPEDGGPAANVSVLRDQPALRCIM